LWYERAARALPSVRAWLGLMETGLRNRPRAGAAGARDAGPGCSPSVAGDRGGEAAPAPTGRLSGGELLRSGPRQLLASPLSSGAWRPESDRRFGEHRGQPPAATGQE